MRPDGAAQQKEREKIVKEKQIRPVWPIYLFGLVFLAYGLIFPLYKLGHLIAALALSAAASALAMHFAPKKTVFVKEKEQPVQTGDETADRLIQEGREAVERLRRANDLIDDPQLSAQMDRMERAGKGIFAAIAEKPEKAPQVRRFMNYYLPTSLKILESYAKLSATGSSEENVSSALKSVRGSMEMVARAFEKQLDSLYADEALDITTDIEVLETMMKSEGLSDDGSAGK